VSRRISPEVAAEIERLYLDVAPALLSYACTLPQVDRPGAEDLVQEAFKAAALSWDKIAGRDLQGRRQWLFRVVRNKTVDQWRKDGRCEPCSDLVELRSPPGEDTTHRILCATALERCWSVIQWMPPMRQKVAFLRWGEDWSAGEIAEWLGITQATVRGHLKEARDELIIQVGAEVPFIGSPETDEGG
jgi:RNA polymerase sigma factor (sigma-70 family)